MLKAVLFDLDGTLYSKHKLSIPLVLTELFRGRVFMLLREQKARTELRGSEFPSEEAFYDAFFSKGISRSWYFNAYMKDTVHLLKKFFKMRPWVRKTIQSLRSRDIKIAVLSDYGFVWQKLDAIGFDPSWADFVLDSPKAGALKPSKTPFLLISEALGVAPSDCIVIGDREDTDGEGAKASGMKFQLVKGSNPPKL